MLVIFGAWRHGIHRVPITYHPAYWSLVFPLGMYAAATYRVAIVAGLPTLQAVPAVMAWGALAAWTLTALGLLRSVTLGIRPTFQADEPDSSNNSR